jgi:hypothetical protein
MTPVSSAPTFGDKPPARRLRPGGGAPTSYSNMASDRP